MGESESWLRQKRRQQERQSRRDWQDEMGHEREWWRREAKACGTDWSSLLRQRVKVLGWVRAGRPELRAWLARLRKSG